MKTSQKPRYLEPETTIFSLPAGKEKKHTIHGIFIIYISMYLGRTHHILSILRIYRII